MKLILPSVAYNLMKTCLGRGITVMVVGMVDPNPFGLTKYIYISVHEASYDY